MFILLLRHLGSAGIDVNSKSTCQVGATRTAVFTVWSAITLSVNDLLLNSYSYVKALQMKELFPALERDKYSVTKQ